MEDMVCCHIQGAVLRKEEKILNMEMHLLFLSVSQDSWTLLPLIFRPKSQEEKRFIKSILSDYHSHR